jgi:hypothetical protein
MKDENVAQERQKQLKQLNSPQIRWVGIVNVKSLHFTIKG